MGMTSSMHVGWSLTVCNSGLSASYRSEIIRSFLSAETYTFMS